MVQNFLLLRRALIEPEAGELVRSIALLRGCPLALAAPGYLVHFTVDRPDTVSLLLLLDQAIGSVVCPEGWLGGSEHEERHPD